MFSDTMGGFMSSCDNSKTSDSDEVKAITVPLGRTMDVKPTVTKMPALPEDLKALEQKFAEVIVSYSLQGTDFHQLIKTT